MGRTMGRTGINSLTHSSTGKTMGRSDMGRTMGRAETLDRTPDL